MSKQRYTIEIEPLTGVHIGTGAELTLLDYKVHQLKQKELYLKFSSDSILDRLIAEGKNLAPFYTASDNRDMKAIRQFFHNHVENGDIEYPCDVTRSFSEVYARNKHKDPLENAAQVLQMYRPAGSNKPVIPGSSLKGAIRTAVLNDIIYNFENYEAEVDLFEEKTDQRQYGKNAADSYEKKFQQKLLQYDDVKNDPFRTVLIEDAAFPAKNTQLVGLMKNISAQADGELTAISMQIQAEILRGTLIDGGAKSSIQLTIDEDLQKAFIDDPQDKKRFRMRTKLSLQQLAQNCNDFFWNEFNTEYEKFYRNTANGIKIISALKKQLDAASQEPQTFILRVGRWSQVEFVTFEENFRKPKAPARGGQTGKYGTTRIVFDYDGEYVPLGWCKCTYKKR